MVSAFWRSHSRVASSSSAAKPSPFPANTLQAHGGENELVAVLGVQGAGELHRGGRKAGRSRLGFLDDPPLGQALRMAVLLDADQPLAQVGIRDAAIDNWRIALDDLRQAAVHRPAALGAGNVDARVGGALELQQALAYGPAVVDATHHVRHRGDGVLKEGFVEGRSAGDQADGAHLHTGLVHVH